VIMAVPGYLYLLCRQKELAAAGEIFIEPENGPAEDSADKLPDAKLSLLPLAAVIAALNIFKLHVITSLLAGIIFILILNIKKYRRFVKTINEGAAVSLTAIMNTSAAVGFGAVVMGVPAFAHLAAALAEMPGSPLVSLAVAVNVLAGATGSASGGLGIALSAMGAHYYEAALAHGIPPAVFHRVASIASGGLDSLPHNGAILTLFAVTGTTHKDSYKDLAVIAIVMPLVALAAVIILAGLGVY